MRKGIWSPIRGLASRDPPISPPLELGQNLVRIAIFSRRSLRNWRSLSRERPSSSSPQVIGSVSAPFLSSVVFLMVYRVQIPAFFFDPGKNVVLCQVFALS